MKQRRWRRRTAVRNAGLAAVLGVMLTLAAVAEDPQALPEEVRLQALDDRDTEPLILRDWSDPQYTDFRPDDDLEAGIRLRRGVVLMPYQRVALYGRTVGAKHRDPDVVAELAAPELWVVIFPYSEQRARAAVGKESRWDVDPLAPLGRYSVADGEILWPKTLKLETTEKPRRDVEPLWVRTDTFLFAAHFWEEWVRRKSLVAAFPLTDLAVSTRKARIWVDYQVEEGRTPTDSFSFDLDRFSLVEWVAALTGEEPPPRKRSRKRRSP